VRNKIQKQFLTITQIIVSLDSSRKQRNNETTASKMINAKYSVIVQTEYGHPMEFPVNDFNAAKVFSAETALCEDACCDIYEGDVHRMRYEYDVNCTNNLRIETNNG
jgi:hypothetical protein